MKGISNDPAKRIRTNLRFFNPMLGSQADDLRKAPGQTQQHPVTEGEAGAARCFNGGEECAAEVCGVGVEGGAGEVNL